MSDANDGRDAGGVPGSAPGPLPAHLDPRGRGRRASGSAPPGAHRKGGGGAREVVPAAAPRRRGRRILSWVAAITSIVLLVGAAGGYVLVTRYNANINRVDVFGNDAGAGARPATGSTGAKNILIVGSDSRGDLAAGEGSQGKGKEFVTGQRSDTVILAHLYGGSQVAQLVSFPRDSWVPIPEHVSAEGEVVPQREEKLNAAFFEGGPPLLIRTIEKLTNLRIDNYMQVDFDGFQAMVDALGGVEVCLSEPAREKDSGIDLPAGRQVIQGDQALAFVRQRKGLALGDIDRIGRQQQFIGAIVRKTLSAGTLLNPFKLNGVITVATQSLEVDEDLSIGDLRDLAVRFQGFDAGGVVFTTVPVADIAGRRGGQDVVLLDGPQMQVLFDGLRRDRPPGTPEPAAPEGAATALTVPPAAVQVKVFNGAGVAGLGRRAYDDLEAVGFTMVGTPGNRGDTATGSVVYHGRETAEAARTVVAAIPGATAQLSPGLTRTLEVVVGSQYTGAEPVTVAGSVCRSDRGPRPDGRGRPLRSVSPLTAWTAGLVGERVAAQPLLTLYAGGGRVELSGATTANWVAKSANLLVDGLGTPARVGVLLPLHWQAVVLVLATVATGATAVVTDDPADLGGCGAAFVLPARAQEALDAGVEEVLALSGHPFGGAVPPSTTLPPLVQDYGLEVPSYGDSWGGRAPGRPSVEASGGPLGPLPDLGLSADDRVLASVEPADAASLARLLAVLSAGASLVLVPPPGDGVDAVATAATERATATLGVTVPGLRPLDP